MRAEFFIFLLVLTQACHINASSGKEKTMPPHFKASDGLSSSDAAHLKQKLTPQQYACTQEAATEKPFDNAYWDNHQAGLYVDVVDGTPLFLSSDKFDSRSGWPSFTKPVDARAVVSKRDVSHGMIRDEVVSRAANSHLGHVFDDGPAPSHQRFCINSASLRFVPVVQMRAEGYESYLFELASQQGWEIATVAGGCFWGVEELMAHEPGVLATEVGYAGGQRQNVGYEQVSTGMTGHAEAVRILFDPTKTRFETILKHFFSLHDPTTPNRQANDRGTQYRSAIFYANDKQAHIAKQLIEAMTKKHTFDAPIVTEVSALPFFIRGEDYHQHYLDKHPNGYRCHTVKPLTLPE